MAVQTCGLSFLNNNKLLYQWNNCSGKSAQRHFRSVLPVSLCTSRTQWKTTTLAAGVCGLNSLRNSAWQQPKERRYILPTEHNCYQAEISMSLCCLKMLQTNSIVSVCECTTPTERPPLVGEVIANFCG
jgi:hypothetical protein